MNCPNCGATMAPESRFCSQCGTAFKPVGVEDTGALSPVGHAPDTEPLAAVGQGGYAVLIVYRGPSEGMAFPLTTPVVQIGRGADQQVFLDDITVSRRHAELRNGPGGWQIVDLGSLNGTYVNRHPVQEATLTSGDEVQVGKYRFRFMAGAGGGRA